MTQAPAPAGEELDAGNYEVIRGRLLAHGAELRRRADLLNDERKRTFGQSELEVVANLRVRTENNCVPRDIVQVGGQLLFGFNVYIGLKSETRVADVFSLYELGASYTSLDCRALGTEAVGGFLNDPEFGKGFTNLFKYNRDARLLQLVRTDTRLLSAFQAGSTHRDLKVFRFRVEASGKLVYVDDRGDEDYAFPRAHEFEWTPTTPDDHVDGRYVDVADDVFVGTTGGTLSLVVEDNTSAGRTIHVEPLDDADQQITDAHVSYAKVAHLVLIRVLPYREKAARYFVFNSRLEAAQRIDAIGVACQLLPGDHGLIFPGGYYLETGEHKLFEGAHEDLEYRTKIASPNGEDVLFVYHRRHDGHYVLFAYNVIEKEVKPPIHCHGYSLFDDGRLVVFRAVSDEPTRLHPVQVWKTPFTSLEFAAAVPTDDSLLARVGNAELVRAVSDAFALARAVEKSEPSRRTFEDLIVGAQRLLDGYHFIAAEEAQDLASVLVLLRDTADLVVDEFEKVVALRTRAAEALSKSEAAFTDLGKNLREEHFRTIDPFLEALASLRTQRGQVITLRELRYVELAKVAELEKQIGTRFDAVSRATVRFLLGGDALAPLVADLAALTARIPSCQKSTDVAPLRKKVDATAEGLGVLSEIFGGLPIEDPTQRTKILSNIGEVFAQLNRTKAALESRRKELAKSEGRAEFAAQFALLGQSVTSSIALCDTPEKCDAQLSRVTVQLEELEGKFSELDEFLGQLTEKREEIADAFGARRQLLLDERQRRIDNVASALDRILEGVGRRARAAKSADELNAYFASDAMVEKVGSLAAELAKLGDTVKGDAYLGKLKSARQDALRGLRDKLELFEGGESELVRFGQHRFSVNTQALELTIVPKNDGLALHLTGTEYFAPIEDAEFLRTREYWRRALPSESAEVYRGEYLAYTLLAAGERREGGLMLGKLRERSRDGTLLELVQEAAQKRYDEGYDRGVHDRDAARLLEKLVDRYDAAGLLRFEPAARVLATLFYAHAGEKKALFEVRAKSLGRLRHGLGTSALGSAAMTSSTPDSSALGNSALGNSAIGHSQLGNSAIGNSAIGHSQLGNGAPGTSASGDGAALSALAGEVAAAIALFVTAHGLESAFPEGLATSAAAYLTEELVAESPRFVTSRDADELAHALFDTLEATGKRLAFEADLQALCGRLREQLSLARAWVDAFVACGPAPAKRVHLALEAAAIATRLPIDRSTSAALAALEVSGLEGQHARIQGGKLELRIDEFLARLGAFAERDVPAYREYRRLRHALVERERERLRLGEYVPKVLTAFVRNKLITDVYLPLIGNNLAKQIGAAGAGRRTDLMGLLLLISPPGYGKTTLMEYVASRLGLVFVKVNGPALGHDVASLDPANAPNATARQEVEKINFAFEMGNNVMLYLDDIQHTNPELLQKFISLCDAQRRIEGVWRGKTQTYEFRGKKFCVVMAGNPYTESGDKFRIPDMLANRADTYNLGDVLSGKEEAFALSYIENTLTSNPVLQPLATREQADLYKLVRMSRGEEVASSELSYGYSAVETNEITSVLRHLFRVQKTLLAVNLAYIESASQDEKFRTEPRFLLQGSYRNMNRIAERVAAAMNDGEVEQLIRDHYAGESQNLTSGAEANLLKLAELRGTASAEEKQRWQDIKGEVVRQKRMGGSGDDPVSRVTGTLSGLSADLAGIKEVLAAGSSGGLDLRLEVLGARLGDIHAALDAQGEAAGTRAEKAFSERSRANATSSAVAEQLAALGAGLEAIRDAVARAAQASSQRTAEEDEPFGADAEKNPRVSRAAKLAGKQQWMKPYLLRLEAALEALGHPKVDVALQPSEELRTLLLQQQELIERALIPMVSATTARRDDSDAVLTALGEVRSLLTGLVGRE